ncbi:MAG TPA: hypothetical protein VEH76_13760 [Methylocystis sp.]|nr:hypothetical protein [Methylocystis sp.]
MSYVKKLVLAGAATLALSTAAKADGPAQCSSLPSNGALATALGNAVKNAHGVTGALDIGFNLNMWATVVASDGTVCAVAYSGPGGAIQGQWLASRVISAQKANTANDLSLGVNNGPAPLKGEGFAISTANLYSATQPGGSLYGLQHSNPVAATEAYGDKILGEDGRWHGQGADSKDYGTPNDPMVGLVIGGINVFGGGLGLYATGNNRLGGLGVSGDTSCMDHIVAWYLRQGLGLDHLGTKGQIQGFNSLYGQADSARPDNIIFDITPNINGGTGVSATGYGHPVCYGALTGLTGVNHVPLTNPQAQAIVNGLPAVSN